MLLRPALLRATCVAMLLLAGTTCASSADPATTTFACDVSDPIVFDDDFGCLVTYQAFAGSRLDALSVDATVSYLGDSSLKILVPAPGAPSGSYAGGAFVTSEARSLVTYNALSFWVTASRAVTLDVAGIGNDNTGTSTYEAKRTGIPITTGWTKVLVPIPLPGRLEAEDGLFFFAEGPQGGAGLTVWVDEVRFVDDGTISNPRPILTTQTLNVPAGTTVSLNGTTRTIISIGGVDQTVTHTPGYFSFASSNPSVATVIDDSIHVLGAGSAVITAKLGAIDATGSITVNALVPPMSAAPTPSVPSSDVLSLFSNAYSNHAVDTWSATWDQANVADIQIAGDDTKLYTNLVYAGIEFTSQVINASAMTGFHMDVWVPSGTVFRVKLVDFGANGVYGGGDDSQHELTFNAASTPPLTTGTWVGLEIPLTDFTGLVSRDHLAQLIISGDTRIVYVDNVYFHGSLVGVGDRPTAEFALRGVVPNPWRHAPRVSFSLGDSRPATLSLFDVSGRQWVTRRVEAAGPGWQTVSLGEGNALPAGVYVIRLVQDGRSLTTRAVVTR